MVGLIWKTIRNLLKQNTKYKLQKLRAHRIIFNQNVLESLLRNENKVPIVESDHDIQLGNSNALVQITVLSNPLCDPCKKAHSILHELLEIYDLGVNVKFAISTKNSTDSRTKVVEYIFQRIAESKNQSSQFRKVILKDWFLINNLDAFKQKYPAISSPNVDEMLESHSNWSENSGLSSTPSIIINGHLLPKQYSYIDLPNIIRGMNTNKVFIATQTQS